MDEYKSNQIKYERNSNKSNQIKYAAAEKRIQIIQIKYATCERIIFVWTPCILRCRYVASRNRPSTRNADNKMILPAITRDDSRRTVYWAVILGFEHGHDPRIHSVSQSVKKIFEYNKSNTNTNTAILRAQTNKNSRIQIRIRPPACKYESNISNFEQIRIKY